MIYATIAGIVGLLLITTGVLVKKRKKEDLFYIFGGFALLAYSISKGDVIFIILQVVFTFAAIVDYLRR